MNGAKYWAIMYAAHHSKTVFQDISRKNEYYRDTIEVTVGTRVCHHKNRGSPTRGPPDCIKRPTATFVNCVYTTKMTKQVRRSGIPLTVIFPGTTRKPAHSNGHSCSP